MNAFKGLCVLATIAALTLTGCSSPRSDAVYAEVPDPSDTAEVAWSLPQETTPTADPAGQQAQSAVEIEPPEMIVTPDDMLTGSIVSVNDVGRFVVLTFPLGRMPQDGSTLFVYRQGLKVAELTVTGPSKDDHTVADIRTGECRIKDEVRNR